MLFGYAIATGIICLYIIRKFKEFNWGVCQSQQRLDGKVVVITGANSGIGKETARELAKRGAIVVFACRNRQRALKAVESVKSTLTNGDLIFIHLDLSDLSSVKKCAENILSKFTHIDVLVNNAGVVFPTEMDMKTCDGYEAHFGVNHLGHFLFTNLLLDKIRETKDSRIVFVSSLLYKNGKIDFNTISRCSQDFVKRNGRNPCYADSKLCNILHAYELSKRLKDCSTGVFVVCPGFVYSGLFRNSLHKYNLLYKIAFLPVAFWYMKTPKQGAQTSIHCAVSEDLNGISFGFYRDCKAYELAEQATDNELSSNLWDFSSSLVKAYL